MVAAPPSRCARASSRVIQLHLVRVQVQGDLFETKSSQLMSKRKAGAEGQAKRARSEGPSDLEYVPGFGNHLDSEALKGALPKGQNNPQKVRCSFWSRGPHPFACPYPSPCASYHDHSLTSLNLQPVPPCRFHRSARSTSMQSSSPARVRRLHPSLLPPICPPCRLPHARALQAAGPRLWALFPGAYRHSAGAHPRDREYAWAVSVSCAGEGACSSSERTLPSPSLHPHCHTPSHPHTFALTPPLTSPLALTSHSPPPHTNHIVPSSLPS